MSDTFHLNDYVVTLKGDSAPYFWVYAEDFEITKHSLTHEPYAIMFGIGSDTVCSVRCSDVAKIEQVICGKCVELNI